MMISRHMSKQLKSVLTISKIIDPNQINILIGHLTIKGGKTSESERPLTIGTVESVKR